MAYYLTKSNPNKWRLKDYLKALDEGDPGWWSDVCKDAKPGDILFIGLSGGDAGIYAKANIISRPYLGIPDREYYINSKDVKQRLGVDVGSFHNLVDRPILEHSLLKIKELNRVARWLHVQGGNRHLTEKEGRVLNRLI
jgi:hypothetical protein